MAQAGEGDAVGHLWAHAHEHLERPCGGPRILVARKGRQVDVAGGDGARSAADIPRTVAKAGAAEGLCEERHGRQLARRRKGTDRRGGGQAADGHTEGAVGVL